MILSLRRTSLHCRPKRLLGNTTHHCLPHFRHLGFGPFSALYFVCYERFKSFSKEFANTETLSLPYLISSSALAGAVASFVTSPLDLAKLRLQVQRVNNNHRTNVNTHSTHSNNNAEHQYKGMVDCLQHAYRRGGISGLFRGAGARVLHFVPATSKSWDRIGSLVSSGPVLFALLCVLCISLQCNVVSETPVQPSYLSNVGRRL
jgi:Mitochondrial carrier protein